jgi:hypothetical protein
MLTSDAISQKIFEALRDSDAILDLCQDLFSKPHTVCLGLSGADGPPPEECPVFEVIAWTKERGEGQDNWPFLFSVNLYLEDNEITREITMTGVKTLSYRGTQSLEILLDLARTAVAGISNDLFFDDMSFLYDPVEYFPLFAGALTVNLSFPKLIGGFEPTL